MTQSTTQLVLDAIATGNVDLMKGIAATYTDLSADQIKALMFAGSLSVTKSMIANLGEGSAIFTDIAKTAITAEEAAMGITGKVVDAEGALLDPFVTLKESCGSIVEEDQAAEVRYAMDNLARVILAINLDGLDKAAVTQADIVLEIQKSILGNQNAPEAVVTPYLTSSVDALRALAFVHTNTNNAEIVAVMTAEDAAGNNIDGFKLAMVALLKTDAMITANASIVAYLLGANQSTPVSYAMFKNYVTVVLNGGATVSGVDTAALVSAYVK